jgi:hypothetical protein
MQEIMQEMVTRWCNLVGIMDTTTVEIVTGIVTGWSVLLTFGVIYRLAMMTLRCLLSVTHNK